MDPAVGGPPGNQQRCAALLDVIERAPLEAELPLGVGRESSVDHDVLNRNLGRHPLTDLVADSDKHNPGLEAIAVGRGEPCRRVAAVGTTGDPDPVVVGDARRHQGVNRIDQIVELLARGIALPQLREFNAPPRAATIVRVEHRIAPRRRQLTRC